MLGLWSEDTNIRHKNCCLEEVGKTCISSRLPARLAKSIYDEGEHYEQAAAGFKDLGIRK